MAQQTAETFLQSERERFQNTRKELEAKRAKIDQQIDDIDRELAAIDAYEAVKAGKVYQPSLPIQKAPRKASGPRAPRGARAEFGEKIHHLLTQHPSGLVAKQIADALPEVKGLGNLLTKLKSEGKIKQDARRGPYYLPSEAA